MLDKPLIIKTNRLELSSFKKNDLSNVANILTNKEVAKTYMIPNFKSDNEVITLFNKLFNLSNNLQRIVYGIYFENRLIGFINDVFIDNDLIELGYAIHPDYQNKGLMTEALKFLIKELFNIGYNVIRTGAFSENQASIRVMEKVGMYKIDLEEDIEYNGETHHCIYYEICK